MATITGADACAGLLQSLSLPNISVSIAELVGAGSLLDFPSSPPSCRRPQQAVDADVCRVRMTATTSATSSVDLEAWLPSNWTGRFLAVGNGGLGGCIQYEDLNYAASRGFAAIGTNNGHDGDEGKAFLNNDGLLADYVYRSVHLASSVGKDVSRQYYGKNHTKSYYFGCSTGGRQGFKEAQEFPDDFDGIMAGAPAVDFNALVYWFGHVFNLTGEPGSATFLDAREWDLVYADVLRQCDALDGVADGVLEDPDLCNYCPDALVCSGTRTGDCLSAEKAATVRSIFSPLTDADGTVIYPRLQPGCNSTAYHFTGRPAPYAVDWLRYVVYRDPLLDVSRPGLRDLAAAQALDPFRVSTWSGDLSRFQRRGGKLLHWHGLQDEVISSDISARYYDRVSETMGQAPAELDGFYRYFRISGLAHCVGGSGANFVGHNGALAAPGFEPEDNMLAALVRWVEDGTAPDSVLGTRFAGGAADGQPLARRRHCRYPLRNRYRGRGDPTLPESWTCV